MNKMQNPRKIWLIYLDYILLPACIFFTIYNFIESNLGISVMMIFFGFLSFQRIIRDRKTSK